MMTDLPTATQRLIDVLEQENGALTRTDFRSAVALIPIKEAALADLAQQQKLAASPKPIVKMSLVALGQRLTDLAAENQILLKRAIDVQTRIVQIVARAAAPPPALARYGNQRNKAASRDVAAVALSTRA